MSTRQCIECSQELQPRIGRPGAPVGICSDGCRRKRRNRQQARWRKGHTCPPRLHGSLSGYGTYGCRCDDCRAANTNYSRQKRARQGAAKQEVQTDGPC